MTKTRPGEHVCHHHGLAKRPEPRTFSEIEQRLREERDRKNAESRIRDLLRPVAFHRQHYQAQKQSPLFQLPPEVRCIVFRYAVAETESKRRRYRSDTGYWRPGNRAQRTSAVAFLQTCQRAYDESWWLPLTTSQHTLYLDGCPDDTPPHALVPLNWQRSMHSRLKMYHRRHPPDALHPLELENVQLYGQAWRLLAFMNFQFFWPRRITITVRLRDWNRLRTDHLMLFPPTPRRGCPYCRLPASLRHLRYELDASANCKDALEDVAGQIARGWHLTRTDGVHLVADPPPFKHWEWPSGSLAQRNRRGSETASGVVDHWVVIVDFFPGELPPDYKVEESLPYAITPVLPDAQP